MTDAENPARAEVCGVVLCGGASSRMGRDKATLDLGGRTLLERAVACVAGVAGETVLAVGPRRRYGELGLDCVLDAPGDVGPAAGIRSALSGVDAEWFCVLACDMPRVETRLLDGLLERARSEGLDCCFAVGREELPEPVCAIYHRRCLAPMRAALAAGRRRVLAFLDFPTEGGRAVRWGTLPAADPPGSAACAERVVNLNTPEEWERERASEGEAGAGGPG
ncbi:MAG: molybdenum cofactor guanylyltransferase [Planctomycetota bacterium]|jgi:molybdopterin-guanine dinucleotide biosynthesis protein A|nr:molybdenum cofactor guanylyltransferase [Planctomycetota bacterium]MDP6762982.1 molybdenum cofactor guanylyltransferase [Planctomycetota bacterium]MDP6987852.1 molybdenum cofactor guanylyltransferase [Planctomycetota bacterium]